MSQSIWKVVLALKTLAELTFAWEFAAAGRIFTALCVAGLGAAPHLWSWARNFVDGVDPQDPLSFG